MDRYISIPSILFEEMMGFISDVLPGCGPNRMKDAERILTAINDVKTAQNRPNLDGLKPCPFCGGYARKEVCSVNDGDGVVFQIKCKECGASSAYKDFLNDAIYLWNKRVF